MRPDFDTRDAAILATRQAFLDAAPGPVCGDFVVFADGVTRRVSHVWRDEHDRPLDVQTSAGGSWYLGEGWCSFSGSLYPGVPVATLTATDERREGSCWFFHHDYAQAHNGVEVRARFRVWTCAGVSS